MRVTSLLLGLALAALLSLPSRAYAAANWIAIQGADPATSPSVRLFGFVQGGYEQTFGLPVRGLTKLSAYNGEQGAFNTFAGGSTASFFVRRARIGARGMAVQAPFPVYYAIQAEFGDNNLTRASPVMLADAYAATRFAPGLRVKLGQFKLPMVQEALEGNPLVADFINYSGAAQLVYENPIRYDSAAKRNVYTGGGSGFRDIGVQTFDWVKVARWEWTYAIVASNGQFGGYDTDSMKDLTGRLQGAYVFSGEPLAFQRNAIGFWVWDNHGRRAYRNEIYARIRQGAGIEWDNSTVRLRTEYVIARGMIDLGVQPAFYGAPPAVSPGGKAKAWYAQASYRFLPHWEANLRYDTLTRLAATPGERTFRTWTLGGQYVFNPRARFLLNYDFRSLRAPGVTGDAAQIAGAMADRISAQATLVF